MFRRRVERPRRPWQALCLALLVSLAATPAAALPEDRDQPIHITADKAVRDEKQGFTVYQGNVKMDQGSLHIEADRITIYHVTREADKIVAEGKPARLQQQPEPDKGPIKARAETIQYFKLEERVRLLTNAHIEQEGSIVTGDSIDYFIDEQMVRADSDSDSQDSRVQVVIPAQTVQQTQEKEDGGTTQSE
jgi:lipopolysaccharide export system protein LptA